MIQKAEASVPPSISQPRSSFSSFFLLANVLLSCFVAYLIMTYGSTWYPSLPVTSSGVISTVSTSAWCRGANRSDARCRFKNLCYRRPSDEFLFVHGPDSTYLGLDSRNGFIADMTSVDDLNIHYFTITDVPAHALKHHKVVFFEGNTLLLKRFKPDNIMHVLHDDVLPLFATLRELCFDDRESCFDPFRVALMDGHPAGPWAAYYSLVSRNLLLADTLVNDTIYCFRKAYVGINKETTWYNYGFNSPQHRIKKIPDGKAIRSFVHAALTRLGINQTDCPGAPYSVLVSRNRDRLILNKEDVVDAVIRATSWKVIQLDDEARLDIKRVTKTIACAEMLFGMHGAELLLAMFMKPRAILLELFPYAVPAEEYTPYRSLAEIPDVNLVYGAWENVLLSNSRSLPDWPAQRGGLRDLSTEEIQRIIKSDRVAPHTCCEDREWLFRIYQDTTVDISTFQSVLMGILHQRGWTAVPAVEDPEDHLYPGPIRGASCRKTHSAEEKNIYLLKWKSPWNLKYLTERRSDPRSRVQYEIWIRKVGDEDSTAVLIHDTQHFISGMDGVQLDCWIGCLVGNKTGNRQWVRCG